MVNTRMMYMRPGNLMKEFVVESNRQVVTKTGRVAQDCMGNGAVMFKGCLADATEEERAKYSTKDHEVTHTIVSAGHPKAKRTDRLVLGERAFYIVGVDDAGSLGITTIYYAEERRGMG